MYSAAVLDHFKNPRNAGDVRDANATVEVSNPVCGDVLRLSARVENGVIREVRFKAQGCVTAVACASMLTELVSGAGLDQARKLTPAQISQALGDLPQATFHGAQLALDALALLLKNLA